MDLRTIFKDEPPFDIIYLNDLAEAIKCVLFIMKGKACFVLLFIVMGYFDIFAQNSLAISSVVGSPDSEQTVSVDLSNPSNVVALQLMIPLPPQLKYIENSCELNINRSNNHSLVAKLVNDTLKVFVFSLNQTTLLGNNGVVLTFKIKLKNLPGDYTLNAVNYVVSDENGNKITTNVQSGSITIQSPLLVLNDYLIDFGRVPIRSAHTQYLNISNSGNKDLVISSLVSSKSEITANVTLPLTIKPRYNFNVPLILNTQTFGSFESNLTIISNSSDNIVQKVTVKGNPYSVNEIYIANAMGNCGDSVTINMNMKNMENICGWQVEVPVDSNAFEYVKGSFVLSTRKTNHICSASYNQGKLTLLAFSSQNDAFTGNEGNLASFRLKLKGQYGNYTLNPVNTVLSNTSGINMCSDVYAGTVEIKSPNIYCPQYSLDMGSSPVNQEDTSYQTIYNYGNANLVINSLVYTNPDFINKLTLPLTIKPWQSYRIPVYYNGNQEGQYTGKLKIYSNSPTNKMVEISLTTNRYEPNILEIPDQIVTKTAYTKIPVYLNNYSNITAVQFDLTYPTEAFEIAKDSISLGTRTDGHTLVTSVINSNCMRILVFSLQNKELIGNTGTLINIPMRVKVNAMPGSYSIQLGTIVLSANDGNNKASATTVNKIIKISDVNTSDLIVRGQNELYPNPVVDKLLFPNQDYKNSKIKIYSVDGRLMKEFILNTGLNELDVSCIPSGIYYAITENSVMKKVYKIIKK
ncbi:MAG: cohesin domain-containing protein [Paludibacter sp.]|nr:cohesin domain-containing protein [Paludibacter sp.]